ncbi:DUF4233 domain-containing protein [Nocardioides aequoreus]|uniref:DUF4233 domain-containing protein n=1 Tax=Nocardioides aequoreus TaxID=397278 RepID=UPI00068EFD22|nr:DUF4233 domain-containing protein [Nocardioides aequoreus]
MQRRLCAAILTFEAVSFGLVTPVLIAVAEVAVAPALLIGLGLALGCLLVAGLLRHRWAYAVGWALQVAAIAVGLLVPAMVLLGGVFLALWATAYLMGERIERERAEWERTGQYPGRTVGDAPPT